MSAQPPFCNALVVDQHIKECCQTLGQAFAMFPSSEKIEDTTSRTGTRQTTAQQAVYKHSRKQAGLKGLISRKHLITSSKTSSGREPRQHGRSLSIEQRSIVRRHSTATMDEQLHLTFKERVRHFTWTWFTMTVSDCEAYQRRLANPWHVADGDWRCRERFISRYVHTCSRLDNPTIEYPR